MEIRGAETAYNPNTELLSRLVCIMKHVNIKPYRTTCANASRNFGIPWNIVFTAVVVCGCASTSFHFIRPFHSLYKLS
jgi:hypothetical protein